MEVSRLVERMSKEPGIVVDAPYYVHHTAEKQEDNDHHPAAHGLIQLGRRLDTAQIRPGKEAGKNQNPDIVG